MASPQHEGSGIPAQTHPHMVGGAHQQPVAVATGSGGKPAPIRDFRKLFVKDLAITLTDEDFFGFFNKPEFGADVLRAWCVRRKDSMQQRPFGFLVFKSNVGARRVLELGPTFPLGGRECTVSIAHRKQQKPTGGGGGKGGRKQHSPHIQPSALHGSEWSGSPHLSSTGSSPVGVGYAPHYSHSGISPHGHPGYPQRNYPSPMHGGVYGSIPPAIYSEHPPMPVQARRDPSESAPHMHHTHSHSRSVSGSSRAPSSRSPSAEMSGHGSTTNTPPYPPSVLTHSTSGHISAQYQLRRRASHQIRMSPSDPIGSEGGGRRYSLPAHAPPLQQTTGAATHSHLGHHGYPGHHHHGSHAHGPHAHSPHTHSPLHSGGGVSGGNGTPGYSGGNSSTYYPQASGVRPPTGRDPSPYHRSASNSGRSGGSVSVGSVGTPRGSVVPSLSRGSSHRSTHTSSSGSRGSTGVPPHLSHSVHIPSRAMAPVAGVAEYQPHAGGYAGFRGNEPPRRASVLPTPTSDPPRADSRRLSAAPVLQSVHPTS